MRLNKKYGETADDPQGRHRCAVCGCSYKRAQDLKSHITRKGHQTEKQNRITATAYAEALAIKKKQHQDSLPRVRWGEKEGELNDRLGACNAKNRNLTLFVEGMQSDTLTLTQRLADLTAA